MHHTLVELKEVGASGTEVLGERRVPRVVAREMCRDQMMKVPANHMKGFSLQWGLLKSLNIEVTGSDLHFRNFILASPRRTVGTRELLLKPDMVVS